MKWSSTSEISFHTPPLSGISDPPQYLSWITMISVVMSTVCEWVLLALRLTKKSCGGGGVVLINVKVRQALSTVLIDPRKVIVVNHGLLSPSNRQCICNSRSWILICLPWSFCIRCYWTLFRVIYCSTFHVNNIRRLISAFSWLCYGCRCRIVTFFCFIFTSPEKQVSWWDRFPSVARGPCVFSKNFFLKHQFPWSLYCVDSPWGCLLRYGQSKLLLYVYPLEEGRGHV